MVTQIKDLEYYLSLPYSIYLKRDSDDSWFAEVPEFKGCMTYGESQAEVLELIEDARRTWLAYRLEQGYPIPEPTDD